MSSDYRPRGGSSSGGGGGTGGGGGGRRRRGGRGRGAPRGNGGENRVYSNGHGSAPSAPKKEVSLFGKLFGWLSGKKKSAPSSGSSAGRPPSPSFRPEFKEREPRAERPERPPRTERPPKADLPPQEIVSPKLYVGNLSYDAAESDLFDLFSKVGAVKNVEVAMDRQSNRSKGFGFVEMESLDTAKLAAEKLNRTDFMGRQIVVSGAKVDKRVNAREAEPAPEEEHGTDSTI